MTNPKPTSGYIMNKKIATKSNDIIFHADDRYRTLFIEIKDKIRGSRLQAALAVNKEAIALYWHIGKRIIEKQAETKWGTKLIETLSNDLQQAFPETHGFSKRNLELMRQLAKEYPEMAIAKQTVSQLPWGHIILLIQRVTDTGMREWYAIQTIENGWARHTLERHVKNDLYSAQAINDNKASNFLNRLPHPQSTLAQELLQSPYNFDFLGLHDEAHERDIENASIEHITQFLLSLGKGFAYIGKQVPISLQEEDYFIDILLYNFHLHSFCVIEYKATKFKPEHAGQLNFYLNLVDDFIKTPEDKPTIGLLLCKSRNKFTAEYALKGIEKPIGVSEYQLSQAIPDKLKTSLPTIEEIEAELNEPAKPGKE